MFETIRLKPRLGLWIELGSHKIYVEVLTPEAQNVIVFENRVTADVICLR